MSFVEIHKGDIFGYWKVLCKAEAKRTSYLCECRCGKRKVVRRDMLLGGTSKSCGCYKKEAGYKRRIDLSGQRFGRLTVIKILPNTKKLKSPFLCKCDCGNEIIATQNTLTTNHTRSCGCLAHDKISTLAQRTLLKHGMTDTAEYRCWCHILSRCSNPNVPSYHDYGERGISVCDRWKESFSNFYEDMGKRPDGTTLDRIDVNGNYCKENCRWATLEQQANNKRSNVFVKFNGKNLTLSQVARKLGIDPKVLFHRWERGDRGDRLLRPQERFHIKT